MRESKPMQQLPTDQHSEYTSLSYPSIDNQSVLKKNFLFGLLLVIQHVFICLIYGFLFQEPVRSDSDAYYFSVNYSPIFITTCQYMFVLVGFGLLFSYNQRLVLSGMGMNLLITLLSIQWYFLMNSFWTRTNMGGKGTSFSSDYRYSPIYLSNHDGRESATTLSQIIIQKYRATLTDAVKCGLVNSIAFSAILGRAGLLEAYFVSLIGTFGFQLQRCLVQIVGFDYGGTWRIFAFGGTMGFAIGMILRTKEANPIFSTRKHKKYTANLYSASMCLIGVAFIWVFFPMLVMDPPASPKAANTPSYFTSPLCIIYALCSSTLLSIGMSYFLNQKPMIRDITHGPIAGGIAVASVSFYITNPVWACLVGCVSGIVQTIINYIQKKYVAQHRPISTISFAMFAIHGCMGSIWASIFRAVINSKTDGFSFNFNLLPAPVLQFASCCISIVLGGLFGTIAGFCVLFLARNKRVDHFDDYTYWDKGDGIRQNTESGIIQPPPSLYHQHAVSNHNSSSSGVRELNFDIKNKNMFV